jgi:hypothetical protein
MTREPEPMAKDGTGIVRGAALQGFSAEPGTVPMHA